MHRRLLSVAVVLAACAIGGANDAVGQASGQAAADQETAARNDTNPTRAVPFSIRPEVYQAGAGVMRMTVNFRYDQAAMRQRRWLPGRRGMLFRFELPVTGVRITGGDDQLGVGDAYAQLLLIP